MRYRSALIASTILAATCHAAPSPDDRPNVVFIFIDDLGYGDLSRTGNVDIETEAIDRLAAEGIRFTNFYVNSPICSPSRVAVTTGQYPSRHLIHSFLNNRNRNRERRMRDWLDPSAPCIARAFQDAGYATGHFGKWHMGGGRDVGDAPLPRAYGFDQSLVSFEGLGDRVLPPGDLSEQSEALGRGRIEHAPKHELTSIYVDRALDFIESHRDAPFYVHLWLNDVHDSFQPSDEQLEATGGVGGNVEERRFFAVLDAMDRQIGRFVSAIDAMGIGPRTLIVLTGDNGPTAWPRYYEVGIEPPGSTAGFRGRKWSLYEGGIREPLIARWPGTIPAGVVDEQTVLAAIDLFPTFCALAGVAIPDDADLDGLDRSEALLGTPIPDRPPLFWEYGRDPTDLRPGLSIDRSPHLAVRDGRWKLLVNADGSDRQLYDLESDRRESDDLAREHPERADRFEVLVKGWWESLPTLGDP